MTIGISQENLVHPREKSERKSITFIQDLEFYLKTERNMQHNSALKHLKSLKKVIRIALVNEWIKKDPFVEIQFKHDQVSVEFLSEDELDTLIKKEFTIKRLEVVRDIFIFCAFTELAFVDVKHLRPEHLLKDPNVFIHTMQIVQKFSYNLYGEDVESMEDFINKCHAFDDPEEGA